MDVSFQEHELFYTIKPTNPPLPRASELEVDTSNHVIYDIQLFDIPPQLQVKDSDSVTRCEIVTHDLTDLI